MVEIHGAKFRKIDVTSDLLDKGNDRPENLLIPGEQQIRTENIIPLTSKDAKCICGVDHYVAIIILNDVSRVLLDLLPEVLVDQGHNCRSLSTLLYFVPPVANPGGLELFLHGIRHHDEVITNGEKVLTPKVVQSEGNSLLRKYSALQLPQQVGSGSCAW